MDPFKHLIRVHTQALIIFITFLLVALVCYNAHLAIAAAVIACVLYYYFWAASRRRDAALHDYMVDLYDHVDTTGKIALEKLPVGIVVLEKSGVIHWHNSLFGALLGQGVHFGDNLNARFPQFPWEGLWKGDVHTTSMEHNGRRYRIESFPICKADEVLALYFFDVTEAEELVETSLGQRPVIQIIQVDNYEEVMQGVEDVRRSEISAEISRVLGEWAVELQGYFKRIEKDKFVLIVSRSALHHLTEERFDILDRLRAVNIGNKIPITLSIGVAADAPTLMELGHRAQAGLDLALGRGGDQATVNIKGKLEFYGGKARAVEKTGKVKARIVAHALRDLMQDASQIMVMGHAGEDFDSLGAAIGVIKMAREVDKPAKLVVSQPSAALGRLQDLIQDYKELEGAFITPLEAEYVIADKETLLIVVDTHRPSLVAAPKLLSRLERVVIIDHHRRSEEFIANPVLVYIEPYASSTCELVTELLQYFQDRMELTRMEATVLYAGIIVDTKNFAIQSGVRTFEAASYLRRAGADPSLVKHLFRMDFETAKNRAEIIRNTEILFGSVAIGVCHESIKNAQITAAQSADMLLNLEGIRVSFVLCPLEDRVITVSARSDGDINVQMIVEKLGGGGHQTVAGAQLNGVTLEEARQRIVDLITAYYKESENNEGNSATRS
jgi:c-di-AMP phosphodiesterase-like protein